MRELDDQEIKIIGELVKNPRISDNQLSRNAGIPLKTVNTKRKKLEAEGLIRYYAELDNTALGTGLFGARYLYAVKLRYGITRDEFLKKLSGQRYRSVFLKHVYMKFLGEDQGSLILYLILESYHERDILEIFNAELVPFLRQLFGQDAIQETRTSLLTETLRLFHNYLPNRMEAGKLKNPEDGLFIYTK